MVFRLGHGSSASSHGRGVTDTEELAGTSSTRDFQGEPLHFKYLIGRLIIKKTSLATFDLTIPTDLTVRRQVSL